MTIKNDMEFFVRTEVQKRHRNYSRDNAVCWCSLCEMDLLALALIRYPPKYGVSSGGRESCQANYEDFIRHEVGRALAQAMVVIRERPRH